VIYLFPQVPFSGSYRDDRTGFQYERNACRQLIDTLLGVCLQLDIRIALQVSKGLMRLARRRRKLLADFLRIGDLTK
jgi:hypothetical protein